MLNNIIKTLRNKVSDSGLLSGADDIEALKSLQNKLDERYEDTEEKFNSIYEGALNYLNLFADNPELYKNGLKDATEKLTEAIELKRHRAEPYFYLSYIAYLLDDMELSLKYLQIAKQLNGELPALKEFINEINSLSNINSLEQNNSKDINEEFKDNSNVGSLDTENNDQAKKSNLNVKPIKRINKIQDR